ncbi:MAG: carbohydrate ABC transporter permease [Treponema sp.]|nr:carbohydrate ABC transporter permease [Treponema sp.]
MSKNARSIGNLIFDIINVLLLCIILLIVLYPLYFVVIASFSDPYQVISGKLTILPRGINVLGYQRIFQNAELWNGYLNTIQYTIAGLAINMTLTTLGGFALSRRTLPGRKAIMLLITFTMYFSGGMIPSYLLIKNLHMINTLWAMVLPGAVSVFNLIIMRTFFMQFSEELLDAASIDGCSAFRTLFRIVLPLSGPVMSVILLYYGVGHWNEFFKGILYLTDRSKYPLQLVLRNILIQNVITDIYDDTAVTQLLLVESIKYGVIIVSTLPVMMLYPFLQKYFVKGAMIGAIKG